MRVLVITRLKDPIEHYRKLAASGDIQALSGHGLGPAVISFVNSRILKALKCDPPDVLLDIGCGDGSPLKSAGCATRIGIVPTAEELGRLCPLYPEILFHVGLAQSLPLESGIASKIVCNGVLLLLGSEALVRSALGEIARVAKPGALIWLGEIPVENEYAKFHVYRGDSVVGMLLHQRRHKGFRVFLSYLRSAFRGTLQLDSSPMFYARPEQFIAMVEAAGLQVIDHFKHRRLDESGGEMESPYRWNYLVKKPNHSSR